MFHYAQIIAFTGTLVTILDYGFSRLSYSVILPAMKDGLLLNYTQLGSLATGNFIGYLSLAISGGFLAARFGIRKPEIYMLLVAPKFLYISPLKLSLTSLIS